MMERKHFSQILKESAVDVEKEYWRLVDLFYKKEVVYILGYRISLYRYCASYFDNLPYRIKGTCISLDDFDQTHGFCFQNMNVSIEVDFLVLFCEYTSNLLFSLMTAADPASNESAAEEPINKYLLHVKNVIELIGYRPIQQDGLFCYVPIDAASISVAEVLPKDLSYRVIEYNHHSWKGDIKRKKEVLLQLESLLAAERNILKGINNTLEKQIFDLFNNLNLRHNNFDKGSKDYNAYVVSLSAQELEHWYDELYQLCLLAFLELDNLPRKKEIEDLRKRINGKEE